MWHEVEPGWLRLHFRGTLPCQSYRKCSGEDRGNDTDDTSRTCNNIKSIYLHHRTKNSGDGGDDFLCGHCGHVILEDFDPSIIRANLVYQCAYCENNNELLFAAIVGTGHRGDLGWRVHGAVR